MNGLMLYELVDTKTRDSFDLMSVKSVIFGAVADVFPEVTDIRVFVSFYCFKPPMLSDMERNRRAMFGANFGERNTCAYPESHA